MNDQSKVLAGPDPLALLEAFPDAVVIVDRHGRIVMVNAETERLFGYSRPELLGQSVELLVPEKHAAQHAGHREHYFSAPTSRPMGVGLDLHAKRRDGSEFPAEISLSPVNVAQGVMVCAAIRDVTEQRRAKELLYQRERELAQLNRQLESKVARRTAWLEAALEELEAFSYSVSHDLRAPLRAIDGFSRILIEDQAENIDDKGREHLDRIRAATVRMGTLIDQLLDLSRLSRREMRRKTIDLSAMAAEIADELEAGSPKRDVRWEIEPGLCADADPVLIRSVLYNLLGNAWKFTADRTDARIEFGCVHGHEPRFFVRDNGAGFDMEYAGKLFSAFQRLHSEHQFPGSGVGLATVKRIIHRHGGKVFAEAAEGKGATFYFTLGESDDTNDE